TPPFAAAETTAAGFRMSDHHAPRLTAGWAGPATAPGSKSAPLWVGAAGAGSGREAIITHRSARPVPRALRFRFARIGCRPPDVRIAGRKAPRSTPPTVA